MGPVGDPHTTMEVECAVLMLDISQYSRLTANLAHLGPHILNRCVNACLSPMIDHILATGGDIIKFAGDAVVAVWPESSDQDPQRLWTWHPSYTD